MHHRNRRFSRTRNVLAVLLGLTLPSYSVRALLCLLVLILFAGPVLGKDKLSDLDCADGEIAKFTQASGWECAVDETGVDADGPCFSDGVTDAVDKGTGRYFDCGNGTVTDTVTGLTLLQDANCFGVQTWVKANQLAAALGDGVCGLMDGSSPGDWRLMTKEEWAATIDQAIANGCPGPVTTNSRVMTKRDGLGCYNDDENPVFFGVASSPYWSSTTFASNPVNAWSVSLALGVAFDVTKTFHRYVWPIRAGQ
jgi:hypothetical protein